MLRTIGFSLLLTTGCGMGATWVELGQVQATRGTDDRVTIDVTLKCTSNGGAEFCQQTHNCVTAEFLGGASSSNDAGALEDAAGDASDATSDASDGGTPALDVVQICRDQQLAVGSTEQMTLVSNIPLASGVLTAIRVHGPQLVGDVQTLLPP